MYKMFAKDYRVYMFDRRPSIDSAITVYATYVYGYKLLSELM